MRATWYVLTVLALMDAEKPGALGVTTEAEFLELCRVLYRKARQATPGGLRAN